MRNVWIITRRELRSYFGTPLAYVFVVIFVALTGAFAFYVGNFFERGQADLRSFFTYHPWLYLLLAVAEGRMIQFVRSAFRRDPLEGWDVQWPMLSAGVFRAASTTHAA